jgi:hypothetical protein
MEEPAAVSVLSMWQPDTDTSSWIRIAVCYIPYLSLGIHIRAISEMQQHQVDFRIVALYAVQT